MAKTKSTPVADNTAHEAFIQAYMANGGNGAEAYRSVYPKCRSAGAAKVNASRLLTNANVVARLAELQADGAKRGEITLDSLIHEAADIQQKATAIGALSAAIKALTAKAKLAGLWIERGEQVNTNVHYGISDEPMSSEEWEKNHVTSK